MTESPAHRPEVDAVCRCCCLPCTGRRFSLQFGSVAPRIVRVSLPGSLRPSRRR